MMGLGREGDRISFATSNILGDIKIITQNYIVAVVSLSVVSNSLRSRGLKHVWIGCPWGPGTNLWWIPRDDCDPPITEYLEESLVPAHSGLRGTGSPLSPSRRNGSC